VSRYRGLESAIRVLYIFVLTCDENIPSSSRSGLFPDINNPNFLFFQLASVALIFIACARLENPANQSLVMFDVPLLFSIYVVIQAHITYAFSNISFRGKWLGSASLVFLLSMVLFVLAIPLGALHAGLTMGAYLVPQLVLCNWVLVQLEVWVPRRIERHVF
jgi:hypothetical protein